jgi:hypothetical protein
MSFVQRDLAGAIAVLVALACSALVPARAQWSWAAASTEAALEERCFIEDDDSPFKIRVLYAARFLACPTFSPIGAQQQLAPMPLHGIRFRESSRACKDYVERSWRGMAALAKFERGGTADLCAAASRLRKQSHMR